jgi:hypothetical protein
VHRSASRLTQVGVSEKLGPRGCGVKVIGASDVGACRAAMLSPPI